MKLFFSYLFTVLLTAVLLGVLLWFFNPNIATSTDETVSPVPEFLMLSKNKEVFSMDLFLPVIDFFTDMPNTKPEVSAKAVIVYDITTGKTLYSKNPRERVPMASLTKVMTAVIGIENKILSNQYSVTKDQLVGENSMGLLPHEILRLEDLLYGLMLLSGNDAAEVIAAHFPTGRENFILAMNNKAKALGLKDTNFTNPSGLEGDGDQHSTAYDLLVITKYALTTHPLFAQIAQTILKDIPATDTHQQYYLENETNLLTSYPGVKGVKTGYTPEAGYCLITYLEYKDHKIIAVLLGSENRRQEMKDLLDYSLKSIGVTPPKHE
ncbi:MAG: D-alanyl-D-alanine carboxypeptidase [Candidatus Levybacteria bacterium]|nr:D-alanyl-D-alanine carboxypeptidase [Candidatus Levybacteria bacterium]